MVSWMIESVLMERGLAKNAPVALMSNVFVRSRNADPEASWPRTKMGICKRILGERRRSAGVKRIPSFNFSSFCVPG